MDYHMQAPGPDPDPADDRGNPLYHRRQGQTGEAFPEFDMSTVDPNMLSIDQNMFEEPAAQFAFPQMQHGHDSSRARAANPQLGPRDTNVHQPSINTAPPFASRPTAVPRRQYHSEASTNNQPRFSNQFLAPAFSNGSTVPTPYDKQLMMSPAFPSHDSSQSVQMAPGFPLVLPYSFLTEHPQAAAPQRTLLASQVQSQSETFDPLPKKRTREEGYGNSDVEHSNAHSLVQPHPDSSDSLLVEQNRLNFIRYWLCNFPDASLFNRTQMESLATLMTVPIETVEQLCNKLVRSQPDHLAGPLGNARTSLQAELPSSVSLPQKYTPEDTSSTSEFADVVQWVESRGPQCKPTSDLGRLTRRGSKIYQCTRACGSAFARKEDWIRHELCKNYPQEGWVCNLPSTVSVKGILTCSSCGVQNPDMSHSDPQYIPCHDWKTFKGRVFFREDHFREHFRKVHHDSISAREQLARAHFRVDSQFPRECGFCNTFQFESWESRVDHMADHFKVERKDMKDWRMTNAGGVHNGSDDDDDDDDDGHDDEGGDGKEPGEDQDESNGGGAGNDNFQSYGAASKQPPGDSGYGSSGRSGTSSGNKNSWGKSYQYTSQPTVFPGQLSINAQRHQENQHSAPRNDKDWTPKTPSSHIRAPSTVPLQRPAELPGFHTFQGLPPFANQAILPVRQAVNRTGDANLSSEFASQHIGESECRQSACQTTTHRHVTEKLKTFTQSIRRRFQPFKTKEDVMHNRAIDELHREAPATVRRAPLSDVTASSLPTLDDSSFKAISTHASSSTLKVSCLEQRLLDSQIPWGTHWFIPVDALDRVLTEQAIHEELNRSTNLSAWDIYLTSHKIWKHARKIFAILVSIGKGSLVSSFLTEGITDANLPINIPKGSSQQKAWITSIKTFGSWSSRELDDFRRVQWYFLSPIFTNARTQHYELDDNCVMPFIRDTEHEAKSGGFSDVWEVVIHPAHQKLFDSNGNPPIALKRLHSRQYDDFKHEANILTALAMKKHNHLIKLLATYKFRGQYHLMFPFARSNLRQYWEEKEPHLSLENLNWWLKQMLGLASALCTIHNFHSATPSNRIVQNSQPDHFLSTRKMVISREEERYGRHGDLKPENILWFGTTESAPDNLGILQIADLGLGAFHRLGSRSNVEAKSVGGSPTYVPPECALDLPISRAYDIWSLGCIFLECVIWLLEGPKGLGDFADDRLIKAPDGAYDDSFFIVALRSDTGKYAADVRLSVREWIRNLHTHRRVSAFIHDMLDLIAQEMLVVRPQDRITSRRLSQKLEEFTTRASTDEGYLLQEFAVAKRENENLFDWYWTIEIMTSIPTRKAISSAASDSSAQQLAAYAASVVTECTSVCLSTTWSFSRESVDDPVPDFADVLDLVAGQTDPILERFTSSRLAAAPTSVPIWQIAHSDSLISSVDGTESDETSSPSMELEPALVLGSSGTSEASQDEDIFAFDRDHHDDHEAWIANRDSSLFGLELPREFRDKTFFCEANYENDADIREAFDEILNESLNLQTGADATPWIISGEKFPRVNLEEAALAPCPGPVYNEYYSSIRKYTESYNEIQKGDRRASLRSCKARPTPFKSCDRPVTETLEFEQDSSLCDLSQCSSAHTESRDKQSQDYHHRHITRFPAAMQQSKIYRSLDGVSYSLETLVSIFHPSFLVAHLSRYSVSILTTELYAPKDLVYDREYTIGFSLGFGPLINLDVCTFTPKDKKALRSYQKHDGKAELYMQESLPIALNLFSLESHAEELDLWLDGILDSESGLPEYVALMILRQKDHQLSLVLKTLILWYIGSRNDLSEQSHQILRPALKLLITETLLSLVPTVTELPESLSNSLYYLQPADQTTSDLSTDAPRLLTRQMKAAIYYLQQNLLGALFCHFTYVMKLESDVNIAVAFLVAHVLDLVRIAGREFAQYVTVFSSTLVVSKQEVTEYELHMQTQLFGRVRASVPDAKWRSGGLITRLRNLDLSVKGKEKESEEHHFVSAILETVL